MSRLNGILGVWASGLIRPCTIQVFFYFQDPGEGSNKLLRNNCDYQSPDIYKRIEFLPILLWAPRILHLKPTVPLLRRLVEGLSLRMLWFGPRVVHVGIVVDTVSLEQTFLRAHMLYPVTPCQPHSQKLVFKSSARIVPHLHYFIHASSNIHCFQHH
jgi:hypothetical protein